MNIYYDLLAKAVGQQQGYAKFSVFFLLLVRTYQDLSILTCSLLYLRRIVNLGLKPAASGKENFSGIMVLEKLIFQGVQPK